MEKIRFDGEKFKVVKNNRGSQRGELLDKFLAKLNPTRVATATKNHLLKMSKNRTRPESSDVVPGIYDIK